MTDRTPDTTFCLGDSAKYSRAWIQTTQAHDLARRVGIVEELHLYRSGGSYAIVRWVSPKGATGKAKVLLPNLEQA